MLRRAIFVTALVFGLSMSVGVFATQGPLQGNIEAFKVVAQDDGREAFLPADEVLPKDTIEYRLTYANTGDTALRNIAVTDPVPQGTAYVIRTATRPENGDVMFSIDEGKSYHAWPVRVKKTTADGQEVWVDATPDMVTHIQWSIDGVFEPKTEITFTYRAIVK